MLALLVHNPTAGEFAERTGLTLEEAHRLQSRYIDWWQELLRIERERSARRP